MCGIERRNLIIPFFALVEEKRRQQGRNSISGEITNPDVLQYVLIEGLGSSFLVDGELKSWQRSAATAFSRCPRVAA